MWSNQHYLSALTLEYLSLSCVALDLSYFSLAWLTFVTPHISMEVKKERKIYSSEHFKAGDTNMEKCKLRDLCMYCVEWNDGDILHKEEKRVKLLLSAMRMFPFFGKTIFLFLRVTTNLLHRVKSTILRLRMI